MGVDNRMTSFALSRAHTHVKNVCSQGKTVILISSASRDEFGTTTEESNLEYPAFPVRFTPFDRRVINSVSWAEDVDVIAYFSKKLFDDDDVTLQMLKHKYKKMRVGVKKYDIRYIDYYDAFADDFLYIVVGGKG